MIIREILCSPISYPFVIFQFKYAKITSPQNGNVKKGVIFSTYSALIGESSQSSGKYKTRLKQLLQWCGDDFDGPVSSFVFCVN